MLVSIAIWESGDAKSRRIARCRIARPAVISITWFCIKRFLYGFRKIAYRLRMAVPKLSIIPGALLWQLQYSLLCCFYKRWNAAFFSLLRSLLIVFEKPNQQKQEKSVVEGIFEETIGTSYSAFRNFFPKLCLILKNRFLVRLSSNFQERLFMPSSSPEFLLCWGYF